MLSPATPERSISSRVWGSANGTSSLIEPYVTWISQSINIAATARWTVVDRQPVSTLLRHSQHVKHGAIHAASTTLLRKIRRSRDERAEPAEVEHPCRERPLSLRNPIADSRLSIACRRRIRAGWSGRRYGRAGRPDSISGLMALVVVRAPPSTGLVPRRYGRYRKHARKRKPSAVRRAVRRLCDRQGLSSPAGSSASATSARSSWRVPAREAGHFCRPGALSAH
jgi:hypothetical protein